MATAKANKGRNRKRSIAGYNNMNYLAGAVGLWGPMALDRLPNGFDTLKAGQGGAWWNNKRVLIILGAYIYCLQSDALKWRLWSIPLGALLTAAVLQHKATYDETGTLAEAYG